MLEKDKLARLEPVELRNFWKDEAGDFTPWLAEEENLNLLAETLNMELEFEDLEVNVGEGSFRADILCRNREDERVLIENQLERTDHSHLGQILTYASGLDAQTVIWVAKEFRDEHRAALDWLNEITAQDCSFFGVEIKLWKIGDSPLAPEFNVVCKPNDWSRRQRPSTSKNPSDLDLLRRKYWDQFVDYLEDQNSPLLKFKSKRKPTTYIHFGLGKSGMQIYAARKKGQDVRVSLWLSGENALAHLKLLKETNLNGLGDQDRLQFKEYRKSAEIALQDDQAAPLEDEADWPRQFEWLAATLERFDEVFRPLIDDIDPEDWESFDGDEDE